MHHADILIGHFREVVGNWQWPAVILLSDWTQYQFELKFLTVQLLHVHQLNRFDSTKRAGATVPQNLKTTNPRGACVCGLKVAGK